MIMIFTRFTYANIDLSFYCLFQTFIEELSEEAFNNHVEALVTKRLEKPKKIWSQNNRYWSEITCQQYNFDRGTTLSTIQTVPQVYRVLIYAPPPVCVYKATYNHEWRTCRCVTVHDPSRIKHHFPSEIDMYAYLPVFIK